MAVEPKTQAFLDSLAAAGGPPINTLAPGDARAILVRLQQGGAQKLPAKIEDLTIPGGPTGQVSVRIIRPTGESAVLPAVVYIHGGGWILGDASTHDRLMRAIANGAQAAIVFVNYDRSPEARFPTAIEQAYHVAKHISEHGHEHDLDPGRLVVAGDSVGGNMATAVAMLATERKGPALDFQMLFYPVTDAGLDTPSYHAFANGYWLTRDSMAWFWDAYLPDRAARDHATASPLRAPLERLRGLPPALVITAENDVLRDEGEAYAHKLAEAGVEAAGTRILGTIHDFLMLDALADTPPAREALLLAIATLRQRFARGARPGGVTLMPEEAVPQTPGRE
jgi:acetyl esterase